MTDFEGLLEDNRRKRHALAAKVLHCLRMMRLSHARKHYYKARQVLEEVYVNEHLFYFEVCLPPAESWVRELENTVDKRKRSMNLLRALRGNRT